MRISKKAKVLILLLFIILIISYLYFIQISSPSSAVKNYMNNLRKYKLLKAYSNVYGFSNEETSENESIQDVAFKYIYEGLDYKITETKKDKDTAIVSLEIKSTDMDNIVSSVLNKLTGKPSDITNANSDDINLEEKLWTEINNSLKSGNYSKRTFNIELNLKKVEKRWYIVMDDKLTNAITGGLGDVYSKMINNLYAEYEKQFNQ